MPILRSEMFKGRNRDQKRFLALTLTEGFNSLVRGRPEGVTIVIEDVGNENWAVGGDIMAAKYPD